MQIVSSSFSTRRIVVFQLLVIPLSALILALFKGIWYASYREHAVVLRNKLLSCCCYKKALTLFPWPNVNLNFIHYLINYAIFKHFKHSSLINYVSNTSTGFGAWEKGKDPAASSMSFCIYLLGSCCRCRCRQ
jgi:hypothetical protein